MKELSLKALESHFILNAASGGTEATHVLMLVHGRTGNIRILEWVAKRFQVPGLAYLSVQAPFEDKREDQEDPGFSWYLEGRQGLAESRQKLIESIHEIEAQGVPARNIFWLGFSQGAAVGLDLALRGPFRLGGLICVSGFCLENADYPGAFGPYAKEQRLLITHGRRDEMVPLEKAEKSFEVLHRYGVPHEYLVFDKPHSFHLRQELPVLEERLRDWIRTS